MKILFEDNHILVAEKPVNIPVQADESGDLDFLSMLKQYIGKKYQKPGNVYLGLVHRLDRPVGGVMVFARTSKAASRLSDQVRTRQMTKIYLAIVNGLPDKTGTLQHWLWKDEKENKSVVYDKPRGQAKEAILHFEVIGSADGLSLLKIDLETGRSHQIRAQFATIGHPLWGDHKYGTSKTGRFPALHAWKLSFEHPVKKELLTFTSEYPVEEPWNNFSQPT